VDEEYEREERGASQPRLKPTKQGVKTRTRRSREPCGEELDLV